RIFFFSSRRRHTRFSRDWSSDVCSSDLSLLIIHMVKKLQIKEGESTRKGRNRLTNVMKRSATRKLGFPMKLKWLTTLFSKKACTRVNTKVTNTLARGVSPSPNDKPMRLLTAGSMTTGVS